MSPEKTSPVAKNDQAKKPEPSAYVDFPEEDIPMAEEWTGELPEAEVFDAPSLAEAVDAVLGEPEKFASQEGKNNAETTVEASGQESDDDVETIDVIGDALAELKLDEELYPDIDEKSGLLYLSAFINDFGQKGEKLQISDLEKNSALAKAAKKVLAYIDRLKKQVDQRARGIANKRLAEEIAKRYLTIAEHKRVSKELVDEEIKKAVDIVNEVVSRLPAVDFLAKKIIDLDNKRIDEQMIKMGIISGRKSSMGPGSARRIEEGQHDIAM